MFRYFEIWFLAIISGSSEHCVSGSAGICVNGVGAHSVLARSDISEAPKVERRGEGREGGGEGGMMCLEVCVSIMALSGVSALSTRNSLQPGCC